VGNLASIFDPIAIKLTLRKRATQLTYQSNFYFTDLALHLYFTQSIFQTFSFFV